MTKKKRTNNDAESSKETSLETPAETAPSEQPEAIAKSEDTKVSLAKKLNGTDLFLDRFLPRIQAVEKDMPDKTAMKTVLRALPEEKQEAIAAIMRRMSTEKKGIYSSNDRPDYTELRLYQGTGADSNRPETAIPGQFYLTTKENVGKVFEGTVIAMWEGRTMWPDREAGGSSKMPVCISMDRRMGNRFGNCKDCPNLPWRDGKKDQLCGDDIIAFMLPRDLSDIVLVRFTRTSEPAGRQLMRFARKGLVPWERWYRITAEEHKDTERSFRWFTMETNVNADEDVPDDLSDFCEMMCTNAEVSFILPGMAQIYRQAEEARENIEASMPKRTADEATPNYDDMEETPDNV
jgi:hypothetical protein